MKLQVNVVTTHLGKSPVIIDGAVMSVSGLPEDLCTKMICLLNMLEHEGITTVFFAMEENNESILSVKKDGEDCTPEVIVNIGVRNYLEETIELLAGHAKEHFRPASLH